MTAPLYPTDEQIARELFGTGKTALQDWHMLVAGLNHRGMPQPDPITGRRYWPAVRAFLDRRAGLTETVAPPTVDGKETFDEGRPRPKAATSVHR
jgi:hypothetical protein